MTAIRQMSAAEALPRAVRAYDAALTAWGDAAKLRDPQRLADAAHAMDTAYRTMVDLAREGEG